MRGKSVKIIIDTNLWISFLIGQKAAASISDILKDESFIIITTDLLEEEILRVTSRPKFNKYFAPNACNHLLTFLHNRCERHSISSIPPRCRDPKDDFLLELIHVSSADFLITGDKDLLDIGLMGNCHILTIDDFKKHI